MVRQCGTTARQACLDGVCRLDAACCLLLCVALYWAPVEMPSGSCCPGEAEAACLTDAFFWCWRLLVWRWHAAAHKRCVFQSDDDYTFIHVEFCLLQAEVDACDTEQHGSTAVLPMQQQQKMQVAYAALTEWW